MTMEREIGSTLSCLAMTRGHQDAEHVPKRKQGVFAPHDDKREGSRINWRATTFDNRRSWV